jgi:acyl carrier protein
MEPHNTLERFLADELLMGLNTDKIDPNLDLISRGYIDSLAMMQLILFIEERFDVKVGEDEVLPDNFRTLNRIAEFVENKQSALAHELDGAPRSIA